MNSETLLLRQVHPSWIQSGRVTSQAFRPTPKDSARLSAYDGDQISPEDSWRHFTADDLHASTGVLAVSVGECESEGRQVIPDPEVYPEHVLIDFSGLSASRVKAVAAVLSEYARRRGWLYRARS